VFSWNDVILAKSKQIIGAQFQTLFSEVFLLFYVPQYSDRFDYIKDIRPAVYFNNQKIIAYNLYKGTFGSCHSTYTAC